MVSITINTDKDLTPAGKRRAKVVQTSRGGSELRWYVGGKLYHFLAPNQSNIELSKRWVDRN